MFYNIQYDTRDVHYMSGCLNEKFEKECMLEPLVGRSRVTLPSTKVAAVGLKASQGVHAGTPGRDPSYPTLHKGGRSGIESLTRGACWNPW